MARCASIPASVALARSSGLACAVSANAGVWPFQAFFPFAGAPPLWARFYEIETNRPFFANRDGRKVFTLAEVALERRSGYGWYGRWPAELLESGYAKWKAERVKR